MHSSIPAADVADASSSSEAMLRSPAHLEFLRDVQQGLGQRHRELHCKYFYDERGSHLFDQICELEEYYPTRVETEIMQQCGQRIAAQIGPQAVIVEYGSGSSTKTRILLDHLLEPKAYLPVDISRDYLAKVASQLEDDYPELAIHPLVADFTAPFAFPAFTADSKVCVYFPGSTIGNLEKDAAQVLLEQIAGQLSGNGGLLIGIDLMKDTSVLQRAYDDSQGVTAEFNLNLLLRINRELGADFQVEQFAHVAEVNTHASRVEMYLESQCEQTVRLGKQSYRFREGERIFTEYSHKYRIHDFVSMAAASGLKLIDAWTDDLEYFAVLYLAKSP